MFLSLLLLVLAASLPAQAPAPEVPRVSADAGPCWADFRVTDREDNPVYNAKVAVTVRHGFAGLRKTEVEVGTNSDGKARVAGLPEKSKKPLLFEVRHHELRATVEHKPAAACEASYTVVLEQKPPEQPK